MSDILILDDNKEDKASQTLFRAAEEKDTSLMSKINTFLAGLQSVKTKDKVVFYRLLATMTNAWMTLLKSINVLQKQEKNAFFKQILVTVEEKLKSWANFSQCLEEYPGSFAEAEIGIIRSWEKTGQLNLVLSDLADQIEKVDSISWKIKGAMMYPFFIILVVIWVVAIMMIKVVPQLLEIFDDKSSLPASTQTLMAISDLFRDHWFMMIIVVFGFLIMVWIWKKTPTGKYIFDKLLLKIPIFWEINKKLILSKFSRVFSWLLASWVSVVECLKITSDAVWNEVYKQRLLLLSEDVKQGIKIWESLDGDKLFPDMMIQMVQVWEETAKLDHTIIKVADFYDAEVDNTIRVLNKLLEPFIIVTLAIIVGFIAIAILQPIMWLADTISNT